MAVNEEMMIGMMPNLTTEEECAYQVGWERCEEYLSKLSKTVDTDEALQAALFNTITSIKEFTEKTPVIKAVHEGYYNLIIGVCEEALKWKK